MRACRALACAVFAGWLWLACCGTALAAGESGEAYDEASAFGLLALIGLIVGCWALESWRRRRVSSALVHLAQREAHWDERALVECARDAFWRVKDALCRGDVDALRAVLHPYLFEVVEPRVLDRRVRGVRVVAEKLKLHEVSIVRVEDRPGEEADAFAAHLTVSGVEREVGPDGREVPGTGRSGVRAEKWLFERWGGRWVVREMVPVGDGDAVLLDALDLAFPVCEEKER